MVQRPDIAIVSTIHITQILIVNKDADMERHTNNKTVILDVVTRTRDILNGLHGRVMWHADTAIDPDIVNVKTIPTTQTLTA